MMGVITSVTSELTMALKAAPMITATARSTTFPRRMKSRKPLSTVVPPPGLEAAYQPVRARHNTLWKEEEENRHAEDHDFGVKKKKHPGVIQAPCALGAADGFHHAPGRHGSGHGLPVRQVQRGNVGESAEAKADGEGAEAKNDAPHERWPAQAKDGAAGNHDSSIITSESCVNL